MTRSQPPRVLIVGAGIGGLTAALLLARQGFGVRVLEQAPALTEVGAGLQLGPNAMRVMATLGLVPELLGRGVEPRDLVMRTATGDEVLRLPLAEVARERWGQPYLQIHRADLQAVLLAATRRTDTVEVLTGHEIADLTESAAGVEVRSVAGDVWEAEVVVGADGLHSTVRRSVAGPDRPRFTGHVAWRLLLPAAGLEPVLERSATLWMGPGAHCVAYYVRGGELVNCVAAVEADNWKREDWNQPGRKGELVSAFRHWDRRILKLMGQAPPEAFNKWALYDRQPLPQWSSGRTTLLGDACHPTLPYVAQGAGMAVEDGAVLARHLAAGTDVVAALQAYAGERYARTAWIQNLSRRNGRRYHLAGLAAHARNALLRAGAVSPMRTLDRLYRYDAVEG